ARAPAVATRVAALGGARAGTAPVRAVACVRADLERPARAQRSARQSLSGGPARPDIRPRAAQRFSSGAAFVRSQGYTSLAGIKLLVLLLLIGLVWLAIV